MVEISRITISDIERIKKQNFSIIEMQHAIRINGCVDIWMSGHKIYDKKRNQYFDFDNKDDLIRSALVLASQYGEMDSFKKNKTGKISYKEFKHKKRDKVAEYYHWDNNKEVSDSYLYFIKCGIYVKIGKSKNVSKRLKQLQTGMPSDYLLLGSFEGMGHLETIMHRCFSELKTKTVGEWFYHDTRIDEFIKYALKNQKKITKKYEPKSKDIILGMHSYIPFGRYKGKRLHEILDIDKEYVKWLSTQRNIEQEVMDKL